MKIGSISSISFGYSHPLKTLYKNGKLPTVTKGFYGDVLDLTNVSLEHLKPKSKGGQSTLANYVLASVKKNGTRGNSDIRSYFDPESAKTYLDQFVNVKEKKLNGPKYIEMILKTLENLGIDRSFYTK